MTGLSCVGALISKVLSRKPAIKVTEEVAQLVEKEIPKAKKYLKPSETLAFATKPLKRDWFYKKADEIYDTNKSVADLKSVSAPESLISHAKAKYPIKFNSKAGAPKQYTAEIKNELTNKRNDAQIKKMLKNKAKAEEKHAQTLAHLQHNHIDFKDAGVTNPDEILSLMRSGKYHSHESQMLHALSKTGNSTHAKEFLPEIESLPRKIASMSENASERSNLKYALANRIRTVGLIGDETQQVELINKLTTELKVNHDKDVVYGIFTGLSGIGNKSKNSGKYSEILLDQLFTKNEKKVYPHLASFDGQFHIITKGMIENPKSSEILAAAYKSAKTPAQKQIFLNEIFKSEELINTAICSTTKFHKVEEHKAFLSDILSEIRAKKFDTLSTWEQGHLEDLFKEVK